MKKIYPLQRTFIISPAVKLLSKEKHLAKRQHAEVITEKLGDGIDLAHLYLDGSKVMDQFIIIIISRIF